MAMNPFGVNLDALQMMSNPLLRGFASQQQEEEEPVGFWNKIASRMPGYNLPGMQNDMKRQALNEALIMAGASMMQNAGSGNIGSAIAEALTKGMGTYKEGVASQYQGLQEQRKREMEDLQNAREARRLGISEEQLAIMRSGEERAATEFERESEEWAANAAAREAARKEAERKAAQAAAAETYNMDEIYGMLTPQEKILVEAERVAKGAPAALELAQEFYKNKLQAELEMKKTNAIASRYGNDSQPSRSQIYAEYRAERAAAAAETKAAIDVLGKIQEAMSKTGTAESKRKSVQAILAASPFSSEEEAIESKGALERFDAFAREDQDYSRVIRFGRGAETEEDPGAGGNDLMAVAKEIAGRLQAGETPESLYSEYPREAVDDVVKYIEMKRGGAAAAQTPSAPTVTNKGLPANAQPSKREGIASTIAQPVKTWARPISDATQQMSEWQRMLMSLFGSLDDESGGFEITIPETVRGKRR